MKLAIQNDLQDQIVYRSLDPSKKRRHIVYAAYKEFGIKKRRCERNCVGGKIVKLQ